MAFAPSFLKITQHRFHILWESRKWDNLLCCLSESLTKTACKITNKTKEFMLNRCKAYVLLAIHPEGLWTQKKANQNILFIVFAEARGVEKNAVICLPFNLWVGSKLSMLCLIMVWDISKSTSWMSLESPFSVYSLNTLFITSAIVFMFCVISWVVL